MLQGSLRLNPNPRQGSNGISSQRAIVLFPVLFALSTAIAQPQPDMDGSGCVDLLDIALFQNDFGRIDIPGIAPCDFHVDGYCDTLDYEVLASVLGGPLCTCANDSDCADADPCTTDRCTGVDCLHLGCPNQDHNDDDCIREYCTPAGCAAADEPNGSPCDDGYDCTLSDLCLYGACLPGVPVPPCCVADADCDDGYPCTDDFCTGVECLNIVNCPNQDDADADCVHEYCTIAGCVAADEPDFSACDDQVACTINDRCQSGGTCQAGAPDDSLCDNQDDSDADCFRKACRPEFGCVSVEEVSGSPCVDETACTLNDRCNASGSCQDGPPDDSLCDNQDDSDADCFRKACRPDFGCVWVEEVSGSPCVDEIACTLNDRCNASGNCQDGPPDDSLCDNQDDSDADCFRKACRPDFGCVWVEEVSGSPCVDEIACTLNDRCNASGNCQDGPPDDSLCDNQDDSDADCFRKTCRPDFGCVSVEEVSGSPCDDGVGCTVLELCIGEQCTGGVSICGNDDDSDHDCVRSQCDPVYGCLDFPEPEGATCDDGIACTGSDYCSGGQCYGGIYYDFLCPNQDVCDDDCIQFYCEGEQGCVQDVEPESAPCLDFVCAFNEEYSACNAAGECECRTQPPPDWGCP